MTDEELKQLGSIMKTLHDEVDRLRAENRKLVALVKEFADHAADSGWPSTAKELQDSLRAAIGK